MKTTDTLFSPAMARAWSDGRKCRTQRIMNTQPDHDVTLIELCLSKKSKNAGQWQCQHYPQGHWSNYGKCRYGHPGDRLRLLTTWAVGPIFDCTKPSDLKLELTHDRCILSDAYTSIDAAFPSEIIWTEFDGPKPSWCGRSRPGRFMTLPFREILPTPKILSIGARRIQEITEHECIEDGVFPIPSNAPGRIKISGRPYAEEFANLWDSLNAKRGYPWSSNPWVWNIRFQSAEEAGWDR